MHLYGSTLDKYEVSMATGILRVPLLTASENIYRVLRFVG